MSRPWPGYKVKLKLPVPLAYSLQELSGLTLSDVEGVWQGVESQLTLRLRLIEELSEQLAVVERQRAEQVSHIYIMFREPIS